MTAVSSNSTVLVSSKACAEVLCCMSIPDVPFMCFSKAAGCALLTLGNTAGRGPSFAVWSIISFTYLVCQPGCSCRWLLVECLCLSSVPPGWHAPHDCCTTPVERRQHQLRCHPSFLYHQRQVSQHRPGVPAAGRLYLPTCSRQCMQEGWAQHVTHTELLYCCFRSVQPGQIIGSDFCRHLACAPCGIGSVTVGKFLP